MQMDCVINPLFVGKKRLGPFGIRTEGFDLVDHPFGFSHFFSCISGHTGICFFQICTAGRTKSAVKIGYENVSISFEFIVEIKNEVVDSVPLHEIHGKLKVFLGSLLLQCPFFIIGLAGKSFLKGIEGVVFCMDLFGFIVCLITLSVEIFGLFIALSADRFEVFDLLYRLGHLFKRGFVIFYPLFYGL